MAISTPSGQPGPLQAGEFASSSRSAVVTWDFKGINPPGPLYLTPDDKIVVAGYNIAPATATFFVSGRLLTVDGAIVPFTTQFTAPTDSNGVSTPLSAVEGFLLSLNVRSSGQQRGQTYAAVYLIRGKTIADFIGQMLAADYCTTNIPMGWPYSGIRGSRESTGALFTATASNPAAGADWSLPNTFGFMRAFHGAAQLTTSATVANRNVEVLVKDIASNVVYRASAQVSIPASTVATVSFTNGNLNTPVVTSDVLIPLPETCFIPNSGSLAVATANLQAGDQWANIAFYTEQWINV